MTVFIIMYFLYHHERPNTPCDITYIVLLLSIRLSAGISDLVLNENIKSICQSLQLTREYVLCHSND